MTNSLIWAVTDKVDDPKSDTVYSIARRVRKSVDRVRNPEYSAAWDWAHGPVALGVANADRASNFVQPPGGWILNSTWRSVYYDRDTTRTATNGFAEIGSIGRLRILDTKVERASSTRS